MKKRRKNIRPGLFMPVKSETLLLRQLLTIASKDLKTELRLKLNSFLRKVVAFVKAFNKASQGIIVPGCNTNA